MAQEVVVTRKGQTTVPVKLRKKYGISEGTRLLVEDTGEGILFKKTISTLELIGWVKARFCPRDEVAARRDESRRVKGSSYDTRFLIELFYTAEAGTKDKIKNTLLASKPNYLSTAALSEIYKLTLERDGKDVAELRANSLSRDFRLVHVDREAAVRESVSFTILRSPVG